MSHPPTHAQSEERAKAHKWKIIGPGLVVAATGVGAADMVATLAAGSRYGYMLLWAVVLGVVLKIVLVEGAGRYTLATGKTIFEGWRSLGRWPVWYFGPYIIIWGFVYGASAMSSTALPLAALFPSVPLWVFAVGTGIAGFIMIWFRLMVPVMMKIPTSEKPRMSVVRRSTRSIIASATSPPTTAMTPGATLAMSAAFFARMAVGAMPRLESFRQVP